MPVAQDTTERIRGNVRRRNEFLKAFGDKEGPYLYVICATGNIYEDITQAKAAAKQGADIIAVIRTTGQSLLDYVPFGATTEGFGGTYATQENFRLMRAALDEVGKEEKRYIRLCNYCSGLCMVPRAALRSVYLATMWAAVTGVSGVCVSQRATALSPRLLCSAAASAAVWQRIQTLPKDLASAAASWPAEASLPPFAAFSVSRQETVSPSVRSRSASAVRAAALSSVSPA